VHEPVLVEETVRWISGEPGWYLDATVGGGGHTAAILAALDGTRVLGLDRDAGALDVARERLREYGDRVRLVHAPFDRLGEVMSAMGLRSLAGALFDLGLSSLQLVDDSRGFSFQHRARLDLRFDATSGESAADVLARIDERTLAGWLREYGELPNASRVARAILAARAHAPIETTQDLIAAVCPVWGATPHPRRLAQLFQALRVAVNEELGRLDRALAEVPKRLENGAALVVISYHSLEDRRIKSLFRGPVRDRRDVRLGVSTASPWEILTPKPVRPTPFEVARNPRARSARLRAARWRKVA
jgi:16S rRNA (cytosine1402-N4)-methyltransferase